MTQLTQDAAQAGLNEFVPDQWFVVSELALTVSFNDWQVLAQRVFVSEDEDFNDARGDAGVMQELNSVPAESFSGYWAFNDSKTVGDFLQRAILSVLDCDAAGLRAMTRGRK